VIFEAMPKAGGMLRYGIPEYRLPKATLDRELAHFEKMGIEFRFNSKIGENVQLDDLKKDFPLLVKLIDANDKLSIQVHPDDEYARANENQYGKTEMWYIVDAKEGAKLVYGLKNYDKDEFANAAKKGDTERFMNFVDVKKGDCFFIPAGCVHAIGEGILIAEVQQSSDVTYRVFDYNRRDKMGNLRELHIAKALDVIKDLDKEEMEKIRFERSNAPEKLVDCRYFSVEKREVCGSLELCVKDSFTHVLCLDGEGEIDGYKVKKGDSYLLPAKSDSTAKAYTVRGNLTLICSKSYE
jgi:mannose-6-phosphate isomerase